LSERKFVSNPVPKIILHSDQTLPLTGTRDAELLRSLSGKKNPRITYFPSTPDPRRKYFEEKRSYYLKIGFSEVNFFEPEESSVEERIAAFQETDVVHLSGGEVISFSHRMRSTGCDQLLRQFLERGGVVLGVSAGAMILSRTFKSASLFKERGEFFGLGLFDFEIIPHAGENFPRPDLLQTFAQRNKLSLYVMNDGDIVVLHGKKIRTYGSPQFFGGT